jgi:hypothetical protein
MLLKSAPMICLAVLALIASAYARESPSVDILEIQIGKPNPIKPLAPAKQRGSFLPFYSITVPMPENSQFNVFFEYDVDTMFDTGKVYALRAKRTFSSLKACEHVLKLLIAPLTNSYHLKPRKSERSLFEANAGDIEV